MRIIRILSAAVLIFAAATLCLAIEEKAPRQLFSQGNDYYEKGEYDKAIGEYEKILAEGYESGPVYYNIANAYFKSGKPGKAILNYERARRIMPRDADLIANYRFARTKVKAKVIPKKSIWTWRPFRIYSEKFTINELTWLSSGMYILAIILLFTAVIRPNKNRYQLVAVILLFVFILFNSVIIWHNVGKTDTDAVTIASEAEALFGPFDSATKFFTLYEGMNVTVLKTKDDWYKVRRADGKVGWIKKNKVDII